MELAGLIPSSPLAAIWRGFDDDTLERARHLARDVRGKLDPLGGIAATVDDDSGEWAVSLMPDLRDRSLLLAACECSSAGDAPCEHVGAALHVVDQQRLWPANVRKPSCIEMTDPDDPDLELVASSTGRPLQPAIAVQSERPYNWRDLLARWPAAPRVDEGRIATIEYVLEVVDRPQAIDERACVIRIAKTSPGKAGAIRRRYVELEVAQLSAEDRDLRTLLFGVQAFGEAYASAWTKRSAARVDAARIPDIAARLAATGRFGWTEHPEAPLRPLAWDGGGPWTLRLSIRRTRPKEVAIEGALIRGDEQLAVRDVTQFAGGGIAVAHGRAFEIALDRFGLWASLLAHEVTMPLADLPAFVARTCVTKRPPELVLDDVGIDVVDGVPTRHILVEPHGRTGYRARVELAYDGRPLEAWAPGLLVRDRGKRLVRRDLAAEQAAVLAVRELGGTPAQPWPVAGSGLRALVEQASARGFEVLYDGAPLRAGASFSATVTSGIDWFDVSLGVTNEDGDAIGTPELLAALSVGRPLVKLADGSSIMIPGWLERRAAALTAAPLEDGALRFRRAETLLLATLLDSPELAVDHDATFAKLRRRLDGLTGMTPRAAPRGFGATLRDYQRDGLGWLHFLRELGLGGCLADDMGLGKTIQVLALLDHARAARHRRRARSRKPSLVVAPRSLVFHWLDEARRFAPKLVTLEWHGKDRAEREGQLAKADLIVTTYATLRLDRERLSAIDFDTVVLDEAHAIKNAGTATAAAVRTLRGDHRLALTGTPVENRLDDLASIFDFLNPGLLGRPAALRALETCTAPTRSTPPTTTNAVDAARASELAQARALGRVLRPFMLRRTKDQVLRELPSKTEVLVSCKLEGAERRRYDELREHYRRALLPVVERDGVGRNAIVVLEALLRLRQAALHPGLLDARKAGEDSAKLDALIEHLREVTASGHRALVFSQFTTLLGILRQRLDVEGIAFEYLDGKTHDRRERVSAFQDGTVPVFLLSLKAGGVGLNLTAADHVFLLDPWWNPAIEAQAIDRVHRIGQCRPVTAYRLVAEDTVESKILALQAHKRALFDNVFEDHGVVSSMSTAELRALLE